MTIERGYTFNTRSGTCEVLEYFSSTRVFVRFIATGYTTMTSAAQVRKGSVLDRTAMANKYTYRNMEKNMPRYELTLECGRVIYGKTHEDLSERSHIPLDTIKSASCGRDVCSPIKTLIRL